jgi:hypothetical protein
MIRRFSSRRERLDRSLLSERLRDAKVEKINWESCAQVLDRREKERVLKAGW